MLEQTRDSGAFTQSQTACLPAAARRWLCHAIAPETPLANIAHLQMRGSIRLSPGGPLFAMEATETLIAHHSFVWKAAVRRGPIRIVGEDKYDNGTGALHWALWNLIPVMSARGSDVDRSAAGRLAGEMLLLPSALLRAAWRGIDESRAVVTIHVPGPERPIDVEITIDEAGRLQAASFMRWQGNAAGGSYRRFQMDEITESTFAGYTIPARFRAGWDLGTAAEFPFFYAVIDSARYG